MPVRPQDVSLAVLVFCAPSVADAQVSTWSSRASFESAFSPLTIETFTSEYHFLLGSTLNSFTSVVPTLLGSPINPGDIQPGVTYSVSVGPLAIDGGPGFGFLDGLTSFGTAGPLTTTFAGTVAAFGFDTYGLMGAFSVRVNYGPGLWQLFNYDAPAYNTPTFFGFSRPGSDITSAEILGNSNPFTFDIDNFTFGPVTAAADSVVPEPTTITLLATGLAGMAGARRRRRTGMATDLRGRP